MDFPLVHQAFLAGVYEFDRVFDCQDVPVFSIVLVVDHCGQGSGFAGTGRSSYQHQASWVLSNFTKYRWATQLFHAQDGAWNGPQYRAGAALVVVRIYTETRQVGDFK